MGLSLPQDPPELVYLFVAPEGMGSGIGRLLWDVAVQEAKRLQWRSFRIVSDPNAEPFYRAMGAVRTGEQVSEADPTRVIPILEVRL